MNSLYLGSNEIKDISPLAGLNKLWTLSIPKNKIKDISVLTKITKLSTVDLRDNEIEDATPLGKQTELQLLMIERNKIKDLKPLIDAAKADSAGPKRFAPYLHVYCAGNPLSKSEYELRLMFSANDGIAIPKTGKNLIVVAIVNHAFNSASLTATARWCWIPMR